MSNFPYQQPQQTSWIDTPIQFAERERAFFRSVYSWMFLGLLVTAVSSTFVVFSPALQELVVYNRIIPMVLFFAEIGIVIYASAALQKLSPQAAALCFLAYSFLTGLTLSVILFVYTAGAITQAFVATAGMFGAMSVWGRVTKKDLTGWGSFLFMGVIGLILCGLVNLFIQSSALDMTIATLGVFIFTGLVAYKTQSLRGFAHAGGAQGQTYAIYGALSLYITFINLFLSLLRLFGGRRR